MPLKKNCTELAFSAAQGLLREVLERKRQRRAAGLEEEEEEEAEGAPGSDEPMTAQEAATRQLAAQKALEEGQALLPNLQ